MNSSTNPLPPDYAKQVVDLLLGAVAEDTKIAYRIIWSWVKDFLVHDWLFVFLFIAFLYLVAFFEYGTTGRWGMLASVTNRVIFYGLLLIIALLFGSDPFSNDYFAIVIAIVGIIAFEAVAALLRKTGIRRR